MQVEAGYRLYTLVCLAILTTAPDGGGAAALLYLYGGAVFLRFYASWHCCNF